MALPIPCSTRAASVVASPVPSRRFLGDILPPCSGGGRDDLDGRHHSLIPVRQEMAEEAEPAGGDRVRERDEDLHLAVHPDIQDVLIFFQPLMNALYLPNLESRLVNLELV